MTKMDDQHRLRGFKLTISMSFGESVFSAGFNQKTAKEDLFVRGNHEILQRYLCRKTLKDYRRLSIEVGPEPLPCGASRSHLLAG